MNEPFVDLPKAERNVERVNASGQRPLRRSVFLVCLTHLDTSILASSALVLWTLVAFIEHFAMAIRERTDADRCVERYCRAVFPIKYAVVSAITTLK